MTLTRTAPPVPATATSGQEASLLNLEEILGFVAHEIRSPLAVLHGAVMLATGTKGLTEEQLHALRDDAAVASARLTHLSDTLLWLSRLDAGAPIDTEPVNLVRVISETVSQFQHNAKDCQFALELAPELPIVA